MSARFQGGAPPARLPGCAESSPARASLQGFSRARLSSSERLPPGSLRPGVRVSVHGLQKKPEYNDRVGTVKGAVAGDRWCVLLDREPEGGDGPRELSLKPENFSALVGTRFDLRCGQVMPASPTANSEPRMAGAVPASFCSNLVALGDLPPLLVNQAWAPYPPASPTGVACFGGSSLSQDGPFDLSVTPCNALYYLELSAPGESESCIWSKLHSGGSGARLPASRRGAGLVGLEGGLWLWGGRCTNDANDCRVWWFDGTSW